MAPVRSMFPAAGVALAVVLVVKELRSGVRSTDNLLSRNASGTSYSSSVVRGRKQVGSANRTVAATDDDGDGDSDISSSLFRAHAHIDKLDDQIDKLGEQLERLNNATATASARQQQQQQQQEQKEHPGPRPFRGDSAGEESSFLARVLPGCDELMQQPHSPFKDGAFLTSHTTPIRWVPRRDGSRQLELVETCRLKRYTAQQANTCLRHKHLAMIGDSITRYQYLSLAYLLEHGAFPPRFARTASPTAQCRHVDEHGIPACSPFDEPNICVESDWKGWDGYYESLCGGTEGGILNGHMECHSYRIPKPGRNQQLECTENVVYTNSGSGAVLSFLFETGWGDGRELPLHGFRFTNCSHSGTCRRTPQDVERIKSRTHAGDFDFSQTFPEAIGRKNGTLRSILPRPDYALVRPVPTHRKPYQRNVAPSVTDSHLPN
jgi:hypothetical protein